MGCGSCEKGRCQLDRVQVRTWLGEEVSRKAEASDVAKKTEVQEWQRRADGEVLATKAALGALRLELGQKADADAIPTIGVLEALYRQMLSRVTSDEGATTKRGDLFETKDESVVEIVQRVDPTTVSLMQEVSLCEPRKVPPKSVPVPLFDERETEALGGDSFRRVSPRAVVPQTKTPSAPLAHQQDWFETWPDEWCNRRDAPEATFPENAAASNSSGAVRKLSRGAQLAQPQFLKRRRPQR